MHLWNVLRSAFSRDANKNEVAENWMALWADALNRTLAIRDERGANVLDVFYSEVEADPIAVVKKIYAYAAIELNALSEARMQNFL